MIEVRNVTKKFGRRYVLRNVSFVASGKIAVLGYNGAGKSTLAKIIAGVIRPTGGAVRVFGEDPAESPEVRKKIGLASHNPMLYRELTVKENLEFYSKLYGVKVDLRGVASLLGFEDLLERRVSELSRGYLQRVSAAKAMINKPDLLILDEITSGLDVEARERIINIIKNYKGSVILTTHMLEEASFCDYFLVLRSGSVTYSGEDFEKAVKCL